MSDMKHLLESVTKFSFANPKQKPGDQWRGTDSGTPGNKLVGGAAESVGEDIVAEIKREWESFLREEDPLQANVQAAVGGATSTATAGTANAAPTGSNVATPTGGTITAKPAVPAKPGAPAPVDPAVQQDLTKNINQLKVIDPNINVNKTVTAMLKPAPTRSPADVKALGALGNAVAPAVANDQGLSQLRSVLQRLK